MNLTTIFDALQPQTNAAAVEATSAALDAAAARPFSVVLSVDEATKAWLSAVLLIAAVVGVVAARLK